MRTLLQGLCAIVRAVAIIVALLVFLWFPVEILLAIVMVVAIIVVLLVCVGFPVEILLAIVPFVILRPVPIVI